MPKTLYDKIWNEHLVHQQDDGTALLFVDRHLVHEVTSPQAFEGLRNSKRKVRRAKLYYLRDRTGKSARIAEKIRKKIGINIDVKPETVNEENLAPVTQNIETETKIESPTTPEVKKTDSTKKEPQKEAPIAKTKVEKKLENPTEKK